MHSSIRHKLTVLALGVYFPTLLAITHIPIPDVVQKAGVSDKALHFIAFMILSFLTWFSIKPNDKTRIKDLSTWVVLIATGFYSAVNEVTQLFIESRNFDMLDLTANLTGILTGLILAGIFSFWRCLLSVTAITIFVLENLCRTDVSELAPATSITFHFAGYLVLTLIWDYVLKTSQVFPGLQKTKFAAPLLFLVIVYAAQMILQRPYNLTDIIFSVSGMCLGFIAGGFITSDKPSLEK